MASFQPKIGLKRPRNRENKKYLNIHFKLNNTIMDSFQAKIGWEWPKKSGKKKSFR